MLGFGYDDVAHNFFLSVIAIIVVGSLITLVFVVLLWRSKLAEGEILLRPVRKIGRTVSARIYPRS